MMEQVGISTSTISEWKKRKTNPTVEKIMDICFDHECPTKNGASFNKNRAG